MKTKSTIQKPDFAFPATVSSDAKKAMLKINVTEPIAISLADQDLYLAAQLQYYLAQALIDANTAKEVITTVEEELPKITPAPLRTLLTMLLAKMYHNFYSADSWTYDRRELPPTPLPADISQWSGEMFRTKISSLCSYALAEAIKLDVPIADFPLSVIIPNSVSAICYPHVSDFIVSNSYEILNRINRESEANDMVKDYIAMLAPGSAPSLTWQLRDEDDINKLLKMYEDNRQSAYASLILYKIANCDDFETLEVDDYDEDDDESRSAKVQFMPALVYGLIDDFLQRFPDNFLKDDLLKAEKTLCRASVNISYPRLSADKELKVKVSVNSARDLTLELYRLPDNYNPYKRRINYSELKNPIEVYRMQFDQTPPFHVSDSILVTLPDFGSYVIVPKLPGKKMNNNFLNHRGVMDVRRLPVFPVYFESVRNPGLAVVNAGTGQPMTGTLITAFSVVDKNKVTLTGRTDSNGVYISPYSTSIYELSVMGNGRMYKFSPSIESSFAYSRLIASPQILTDRSIYHLGDEVNFCVVASELFVETNAPAQSANLLSDTPVKVTLRDANNQVIETLSLRTDSFGRASGKFKLPTEGLTGLFDIRVNIARANQFDVIGSTSVMVSDYKMPTFDISDLQVMRDTPVQGSVTVKGQLSTYSGVPVADADVRVSLRPLSFWRFWSVQGQIAAFDVKSDAQGTFTAVFTQDMMPKEEYPNSFFSASFSATAPSGETVDRSVSFSVGKQYVVTANISNKNIDGQKPFNPECRVIDLNDSEYNIEMRWSLIKEKKEIVAEGNLNGPIDFSSVRPGKYTLNLHPVDSLLADPYTEDIVIYNTTTGIVPLESALWTPTTHLTSASSSSQKILIATSRPRIWLYTVINVSDTIHSISTKMLERGYHYLDIELPDGCESAEINLFTIIDCTLYHEIINFTKRDDRTLKITAESMREKLTPSSIETWKFRITDSEGNPVKSAFVLDLYNKALDALRPHSLRLSMPRFIPGNTLRIGYERNLSNRFNDEESGDYILPAIGSPEFNFYDQYFNGRLRRNIKIRGIYGVSSLASNDIVLDVVREDAVEHDYAMEMKAEATGASSEEGSSSDFNENDFSFREADVPMAAWAPMLTTDDEGFVTFTFTVPNAITTWRLLAAAWDQNTQVGSLMRDFIANKPLMVQPLMPRFLRQGDVVEIRATVFNNSDSTLTPIVTFELFNPLTGATISSEQRTVAIVAGAQTVVTFALSTLEGGLEALSAVGVRVKAAGETFADGESSVLPLLSSMAQLIETEPFYLNPGDQEFSTQLPEGKDARLSLTYCSNPAWSVVSALPGLRREFDYANSAAAALFSAAVTRGILADNPKIARVLKQWQANPQDSMLVSNLEKNQDLKIALLSATPWVEDAMTDTERMQRLALIFDKNETDRAISHAIETLKKMQLKDGGFAWGSWSKESSYWITLNVMEMMDDLIRFGYLPDDAPLKPILVKALDYLDRKAKETSLIYAAIRPGLAHIRSISPNGQKVIKATAAEILKEWKSYPISIKAIAAVALYRNNYKTKSRELLRSLEEFAVATPSQGITFPNINSLSSYACVLEAFGQIEPDNPMVDGLRQQLIVRKQATDWGSSVITTQVVNAILSSGTKWTDKNTGAPTITVGNVTIHPTPSPETETGTLRVGLSPYAGAKLVILREGEALQVPSYGAVYAQFKQEMADVKASACDDLSIEKHLYKRRGTGWVVADTLEVGDRVKVSLTIISKRNLNYVSMIDERPAAFAPVVQLPGWVYSDGVGFYRENRDATTVLSIDYLRPGTYILEYEMNVQHAGTFSSGVAGIQSQYAPEISAHSSGTSLKILP